MQCSMNVRLTYIEYFIYDVFPNDSVLLFGDELKGGGHRV